MIRQSHRELPACWPDAASWITDHLDELISPPVRLHDHAIGDDGAPRLSAAFLAILTGSPFAEVTSSEVRSCPLDHPIGAPPCLRCDDRLSYTVTRNLYRHPLAAALGRLRGAPATSPDWPTPYTMMVVLLREGLVLERAAKAIGHPILGPDHRKTIEAAFLLATRRLVGRWSSGPIEQTRRISDAQADAEAAA